jgi:hypothetical protein
VLRWFETRAQYHDNNDRKAMLPPPTLGFMLTSHPRFDRSTKAPGPAGPWSKSGVNSISPGVPIDTGTRSCNIALAGRLVDASARGPSSTVREDGRP